MDPIFIIIIAILGGLACVAVMFSVSAKSIRPFLRGLGGGVIFGFAIGLLISVLYQIGDMFWTPSAAIYFGKGCSVCKKEDWGRVSFDGRNISKYDNCMMQEDVNTLFQFIRVHHPDSNMEVYN